MRRTCWQRLICSLLSKAQGLILSVLHSSGRLTCSSLSILAPVLWFLNEALNVLLACAHVCLLHLPDTEEGCPFIMCFGSGLYLIDTLVTWSELSFRHRGQGLSPVTHSQESEWGGSAAQAGCSSHGTGSSSSLGRCSQLLSFLTVFILPWMQGENVCHISSVGLGATLIFSWHKLS